MYKYIVQQEENKLLDISSLSKFDIQINGNEIISTFPISNSTLLKNSIVPISDMSKKYFLDSEIELKATEKLINNGEHCTIISLQSMPTFDSLNLERPVNSDFEINKQTINSFLEPTNEIQVLYKSPNYEDIEVNWDSFFANEIPCETNRKELDSWSFINNVVTAMGDEQLHIKQNSNHIDIFNEFRNKDAIKIAYLLEKKNHRLSSKLESDPFLESILKNNNICDFISDFHQYLEPNSTNNYSELYSENHSKIDREFDQLLVQYMSSSDINLNTESLDDFAVSSIEKYSPTYSCQNLCSILVSYENFLKNGCALNLDDIKSFASNYDFSKDEIYIEWLMDKCSQIRPDFSEISIEQFGNVDEKTDLAVIEKFINDTQINQFDWKEMIDFGVTNDVESLSSQYKNIISDLNDCITKIVASTGHDKSKVTTNLFSIFNQALVDRESEEETLSKIQRDVGIIPEYIQDSLLKVLDDIEDVPINLTNSIKVNSAIDPSMIEAIFIPNSIPEEEYINNLINLSASKNFDMNKIFMYDSGDSLSKRNSLNKLLSQTKSILELSNDRTDNKIHSFEHLKDTVKSLSQKYLNVNYHVVNNFNDISSNMAHSNHSRFIVDRGTVYLNYSSLKDRKVENVDIALGEAITHLGFQKLLSASDYAAVMDEVWNSLDKQDKNVISVEYPEFDSSTLIGKRRLTNLWLDKLGAKLLKSSGSDLPGPIDLKAEVNPNVINCFYNVSKKFTSTFSSGRFRKDINSLLVDALVKAGEHNSVIDGHKQINSSLIHQNVLDTLHNSQQCSTPSDVLKNLGQINVTSRPVESNVQASIINILNKSNPFRSKASPKPKNLSLPEADNGPTRD